MPAITVITLREGTAAAWTSANPVLALGEPGLETDTNKLKFGDGSTAYNSLPYFAGSGLSSTLTSAHLFVGNGSNVATDVAASGDLTLANTGAFTVAKIQGTVVSGTTGTVNAVFSNSPTLVTPALGTPSALVGTNITGTAASFTAGTATAANALNSATTTVVVNAATAPTNGQVLTATSSTAAGWATPSGGGGGGYRALSASDTVIASDNGKFLTVNGTCALALTAASSIGSFSCFVRNTATTGVQIITITPNGADNLDGSNTTLIILPGETRELNCNATAWFTDVRVPFVINTTSTVSPTLPRNGYAGFSGQLWGGGASGGAGATNGGGGGGGGAYNTFTVVSNAKYSVNSVALSLTVGAGGTSQTSANTAGNAGGTTSVEDTTNTRFFSFAYGGGAGGGGSLGAGGGGGGTGNNTSAAPNSNGTPNGSGAGGNAVTTTFGNGGDDAYAGISGLGNINAGGSNAYATGGAGGNASTKLGGWGYNGGAGGGCAAATTGGAGGLSLWGGGGGGGASNVTAGAGGISTNGGSGGAGAASGTAISGSAPGGGGGGIVGTGGSGAGAAGQIILWGII